ncbi:MAG: outer membrane protein transport protein [Phascolarctobacterium sp.]|nr:outer membrane protein transport protein [Phascolarctobacterium sp.]
MKKKALLAAAILAALAVPQVAGAEGFGIVQWSAEGVAMGGARMFAENDVSMVAANPASLTKLEGAGIGVNATYISPHGRYETTHPVYGITVESGRNRIHPGIVPGTYLAKKMTEKDWIGIGAYTRYGMVSGFQPGTYAALNNLFAKMNGLSITPVYAHKFDSKWSAAVGAEINYVGLELNKDLSKIGSTTMHLKGDTYALGWNVAANYAFDKKNEVGVVYRSKVKHSLEADAEVYGTNGKHSAYGIVTLPDQWSIGYNHKFDAKNRVELNATRTNWHTYDALNIAFGSGFPLGPKSDNYKGYRDTWRYAVGYEHKFSDKYIGMLGFSFDDHAIPYNGGDFIVPTGLRRTYSIGMQYNDKKQTVAVAYAHEQIGDLSFASEAGSTHTHNNYAKIISIGYSYKF